MGTNMNGYGTLRKILRALLMQPHRHRGHRRRSAYPASRRRAAGIRGRAKRRRRPTSPASAATAPPAWRRSSRTATPCNCMCRPICIAKSVHGANGCTSCHCRRRSSPRIRPSKKDIASKRSFAIDHDRRSAAAAIPTSSSNGRAAFTPRWCAPAIRRRRSAPTVIIRTRSSRTRRHRSTRFPARTATRTFSPPISAACTRNPGSVPKDSYAPICSGCHTAHTVKSARPARSARVPKAACFGCHAGVLESPPEMAAQCRFAFRSRVLPGLPCARRAPQSRSHADRQPRQGARDRTNRRAAVRCQHQFRRQGHRCADAVELLQTLNRGGIAGKTVAARPPRRSHRPAGASTRRQEQGAQRLPHLSPRRIAGLPERDHLAGRAGRPPRRLRRQRRCAQLGLLGRTR